MIKLFFRTIRWVDRILSEIDNVIDSRDLPPPWNLPQFRLLKRIRKQIADFRWQSRGATFGHGPDRIEIHKPRLEQRLGHRLQGFVGLAVEFDLVVEGAEDMGDCFLLDNGQKG